MPTTSDIRKSPILHIRDLFKRIEALENEVAVLKSTKADKRKAKSNGVK